MENFEKYEKVFSTDDKSNEFNQETPKQKSNVRKFMKFIESNIKRAEENVLYSIGGQVHSMFSNLTRNAAFDIFSEENPKKFDSFKVGARIVKSPTPYFGKHG